MRGTLRDFTLVISRSGNAREERSEVEEEEGSVVSSFLRGQFRSWPSVEIGCHRGLRLALLSVRAFALIYFKINGMFLPCIHHRLDYPWDRQD